MRTLLILLVALSTLLVGCPREKRALNAARKAVEASAQTVDIIDSEVGDLYGEAAANALASCDTRLCYDRALVKWNKVVLSVNSMKTSLLMVELALDAWETGSPNGRNSLFGAAACFVGSMTRLHVLLVDLGARAPALEQGLAYVNNLFGSGEVACPIGA